MRGANLSIYILAAVSILFINHRLLLIAHTRARWSLISRCAPRSPRRPNQRIAVLNRAALSRSDLTTLGLDSPLIMMHTLNTCAICLMIHVPIRYLCARDRYRCDMLIRAIGDLDWAVSE